MACRVIQGKGAMVAAKRTADESATGSASNVCPYFLAVNREGQRSDTVQRPRDTWSRLLRQYASPRLSRFMAPSMGALCRCYEVGYPA